MLWPRAFSEIVLASGKLQTKFLVNGETKASEVSGHDVLLNRGCCEHFSQL